MAAGLAEIVLEKGGDEAALEEESGAFGAVERLDEMSAAAGAAGSGEDLPGALPEGLEHLCLALLGSGHGLKDGLALLSGGVGLAQPALGIFPGRGGAGVRAQDFGLGLRV